MSGRSSPTGSLFSGFGSSKPVSRELSGGMFGSVPGKSYIKLYKYLVTAKGNKYF